ncbi:MAG: hypothetical protein Q9181_008294, partial [Wetmoreana brouardii]
RLVSCQHQGSGARGAKRQTKTEVVRIKKEEDEEVQEKILAEVKKEEAKNERDCIQALVRE